ncbi:SDR family NAD(P)-dependent oxidoreductase [Kribbella jejuensis]|uniref:NADP-dependent 3-hydroxy acid dehydrogenase YdfG n=1 Tax=Kribbella jejuensis TaxID=236068 RepID=A0A542EV08_9ACTN|nr:short-chain dehydrogenase/reductase [Kribbella jejuensis]TQJ19193.1 NADP-dependent 3-hydroxy acid dehydrogenase YdfG [Kribbella jejuensis]
MPTLKLAGATVLLTGAASGIGAATARALIAAGANVALVDLRQEAVDALAAELGSRAFPVAVDVTDLAAMETVVDKVVARFGALDVCFANAGIAAKKPATIKSSSVEEFERIVEVDLLGVWRTVRACLPAVTAARGHILMTASVYAFYNGIGNAPYAASKAGVEAFGRSLRGELAGTGATAGVLFPGWVDTPIIRASHDDEVTKELIRLGNPGILGRPVSPDLIAAAAVRGIEKRSPRVIAPRVWVPFFVARGAFGIASDALIDRHKRMQSLLRRIDG